MHTKPIIFSQIKVIAVVTMLLGIGFTHACEAALSGTGSDSTFALVKALADAFTKQNGIEINLSGGGSSHGAQSCLQGSVDFGFLSRELKASEIEAGLIGLPYAKDGVAIVVNPKNPTTQLALTELAAIYTGEQNWADGSSVVAFNRNEDSGTREVFESVVMQGRAFRQDAKISHDQLMLKQVSRIPTAIGYTSAFHVSGNVKILPIDGTAPDRVSIMDGSYPISRTLTLATSEHSSAEVSEFLAFVKSEQGANIIEKMGYISLNRS